MVLLVQWRGLLLGSMSEQAVYCSAVRCDDLLLRIF
jgi:hypothetical protein